MPAVPGKTVSAGRLLTFPVSASNPNSGNGSLTWSLGSGSPPQAEINPTSGVFRRRPPFSTAAGSNAIQVTVADSAHPFLATTITVRIVVTPPSTLSASIIGHDRAVRLEFPGLAGTLYRVQFKPSLSATEWIDLGPTIVGQGDRISIDDSPGPANGTLLSLAPGRHNSQRPPAVGVPGRFA